MEPLKLQYSQRERRHTIARVRLARSRCVAPSATLHGDGTRLSTRYPTIPSERDLRRYLGERIKLPALTRTSKPDEKANATHQSNQRSRFGHRNQTDARWCVVDIVAVAPDRQQRPVRQ